MAGQGDSPRSGAGAAPEPAGGWEAPRVPRAPDPPRQTAPGTFSPPTHGGPSAAPAPARRAPTPRRRVPDAATLAGVIAAVPLMVLSFFVIVLVLFAVDVPMDAFNIPAEAVILSWFASGAVVFIPAAEPLLARRLLGLRRPTDAESVLLTAAWADAAHASGVDPASYSLWVDERPAVTACIPGGRILAVPRSIVELTPRQRAAVLAHELAHHLRGHSAARLLVQWYSAPARAMLRTIGALFRTGGKGNAVLAPLGCVFGFVLLVVAGAGVWAAATMPKLRLALAILPFLPLVGRWAEKQCDRQAADAGYGWELLAVLERWQESGQGGVSARADALRGYLARR